MNINVNIKNQVVTKYWNQKMILLLIKESNGISRTEISKQLPLSLPSISKNVDLLLKKQIIYEAGLDKSNGGRNPIVIKYNFDYANIMTISLHTNIMTIKVLNLKGDILYRNKVTDYFDQYISERLVEKICHEIIPVMKQFEKIDCLALSLPGIIDNNQIKLSFPFFQLNGIDIKEMLEQKLNIDVILHNDINSKAIGEYSISKTTLHSLVYISMEDKGIGGGIVINGEIYEGHSFGAGELGSLVFDYENIEHSKKIESLETKLYNGEFFEKLLAYQQNMERVNLQNQDHSLEKIAVPKELLIVKNRYIDFKALKKALDNDEELATYVHEYISKYLVMVIYNLYKILNAEKIILGGFFSILGEPILQSIQMYLRKICDDTICVSLAESEFDSEAHGLMVYGANHLEYKLLEK